jgi:hypothetical protein
MPGTVHIVTFWHERYGQGDTITSPAAAFTDEEKAEAFTKWAEGWRKRIHKKYHELAQRTGYYVPDDLLYAELDIPQIIKEAIPSNCYGSDHIWFQCDEEIDLDPEFEETP